MAYKQRTKKDKQPPNKGVDKKLGCGCIIIRDDHGYEEVLLIKRRKNGEWTRPGGKVDRNESIDAAVTREIHEETGLEIDISDLILHDIHETEDWRSIGYITKYVPRKDSPKAYNREPRKHDKVKWFRLDDLPPGIASHTDNALSMYIIESGFGPYRNGPSRQ